MSTNLSRIDHSRPPHINEVEAWTPSHVDDLPPEYLRDTVCDQQTAKIPVAVIAVMSISQLDALRSTALTFHQREVAQCRRAELTMPVVTRVPALVEVR